MTTEDEDMILHLRIKFSMKNGVQILPPYIEKSLSRVDSPSTSETEHPVATATEVQSMLSLLTSLVTGAVNHSEQSLQQLSNIGSGPLMGEKKKGEDGSEVRDHNRGGIAETNMEVDADNLAGDLVNRQVGGAPRTPPRQDETHSDVQSPVRDRSQPVSAESRRQSSRSRSISKERIVSPRSTSSSLGHPPPISPTATKQSFDRQPTLPSHSPIKPRSTRQSHQAPSQQPSNQQQLASSRARLPSESYYSQSDKYQHPKPEQVSVCVFNLPYDIDFEHVKRIFTERCGEISRSNFVCDWSTGQKRFTGRCFLDFVDETASEKALKLDGFVLSGRTVRVRYDISSIRKGKRGYDDYSAHGNRGVPVRGQYDSFDQRHDQYNREQRDTSRGKNWMPKRMRTESSLPENDSSLVRQVDGDRSSYNLQNKDSRDSYPDTENNGLNAEKPLTAEVLDSQKESSPKENEITRSLESESAPPSQQEKIRRVSSSRQREKSPYPTSRPQTPPMDTLRAQSPVKALSGTAESKAEEKNKQNTLSAAVVVSNLPKKMSEIMLFEFFGGCGEIKTINAFDDDRKAYIEFENLDDAQEALQLNGTKIEDTQIQVYPAESEFIDDRAHNVVNVDNKQMKDSWNEERAINDRGMRVDSCHDVRGRKFDFECEREQKYEYRNEDTGRGRYRGRQRYDRRDNNRRPGSFREQDWGRDNRNREHRSGYHMTPSSAHQNRSGSIPKEREPDTDNFWSRDQDIRTLYVSGFSPDYDAVKLQAMFAEKGLQKEVVEARIVIDPKDQMAKFGFVDIYSSGLQRALALHNTKHGENILKITESERPR